MLPSWPLRAGQNSAVPFECEGSLPAVVWPRSRGGIRGGVARGHGMAVPASGRCLRRGRPPGGGAARGLPVVLRADDVLVGLPAVCPGRGRCRKIFAPRLRCGRCRISHALLPAFVLAWRLDVAETVGAVIGQVAAGCAVCARPRRGRVSRIRPRAGGCAGSAAGPLNSAGGSRRWPSSWAGSRSARLPGRAGSRWPRSARRSRRRPGCRDGSRSGCGGSRRR
jgi:hypothetical protein